MNKPKCPSCKSEKLFYIQRSVEYWHIESLPNPENDNQIELGDMDTSYGDDSFMPFLQCDSCANQFDLLLNEM